VQYDRTRASGGRPFFFAHASAATTSAAAPSLMPDAFPAVTVPASLNARRDRPLRAVLALHGEGVLIGAGHLMPLRDFFSRHAHGAAVDRARQPFLLHRIDDLRIAHTVTPARAPHQIRGVAHRLGAAGDDQADESGLGRFNGVHHRLQPRPADAVDRFRGDLDGNARLDRGLPRDVHSGAGLQHAAHDDVAELRGNDVRPPDCLADDDGAEIGG